MKKKIITNLVAILFVILMVIGINIYFDSKKELTKDEFIRKTEEVLAATDVDITSKVYIGSYTYTLMDSKVENLEKKIYKLKEIQGSIVYDEIGKSSYAIHTNKWCIKKNLLEEKYDIYEYEADNCQIEDIKPIEGVKVSLIEKNGTLFTVKVVSEQKIPFQKFEIMVNDSEWIENESDTYTQTVTKSGTYQVKARVTDSYGQQFTTDILNIDIFRENLLNQIKRNIEQTGQKIESNEGQIVNLGEYGIRYQGSNPNNYVTFNHELWRIIGIIDGKVKIIRESSVKKSVWSTDNNWTTSTLQQYLNKEYYTDLTDKNMIDSSSVWYLKGTNADFTKDALYKQERSEGIVLEGNPTELSSKDYPVGLLYPSDYGFAALESDTCLPNTTLANYTSCTSSNWLSGVDEWTITPGTAGYAFVISSAGWANTWGYTIYEQGVRPVVYLNPDVKIIAGDGSRNNSYIIVLE